MKDKKIICKPCFVDTEERPGITDCEEYNSNGHICNCIWDTCPYGKRNENYIKYFIGSMKSSEQVINILQGENKQEVREQVIKYFMNKNNITDKNEIITSTVFNKDGTETFKVEKVVVPYKLKTHIEIPEQKIPDFEGCKIIFPDPKPEDAPIKEKSFENTVQFLKITADFADMVDQLKKFDKKTKINISESPYIGIKNLEDDLYTQEKHDEKMKELLSEPETPKLNIQNAVIKSAYINIKRGSLDMWLDLDYGGTCQGFGGWSLYLGSDYDHHALLSVAGHHIFRTMNIAGVEKFDDLKGRCIRVKSDYAKIHSIGHIIKDDWYNPTEDFEKALKKDEKI